MLVIAGLAVAAGSGAAARAVHAAAELLHILLITAAVLSGAAVASIAGLIIWRIRHRRQVLPGVVIQAAPLPRRVPAPAERPAMPALQIHVHVHGPVTSSDLAALITRQAAGLRPAREED